MKKRKKKKSHRPKLGWTWIIVSCANWSWVQTQYRRRVITQALAIWSIWAFQRRGFVYYFNIFSNFNLQPRITRKIITAAEKRTEAIYRDLGG